MTTDERVRMEAMYIAETGNTIRRTATRFGISKSTVYVHMTQRLKYIDRNLYVKVSKVFAINKAERHIRGGIATKRMYALKDKRDS